MASIRTKLLPIMIIGSVCSGQTAIGADTESGAVATADQTRVENMVANGVWTSADGAKVTYEASFFEPYQTVNAADMLRWVPGGAALLPNDRRRGNDQDKRGFGSGGDQILINGKRLSGKSNDINSAMQRIQSDIVSRIEVIRGTTAGLDVRSEGTLINIVITEDLSGGSGSWRLHSGYYGDSPEYDGLLSYTNSIGKLNYLVSAEYGPYNRGSNQDRIEEFYTPDGTLSERRETSRPELEEQVVLNTSGNWSFDNGDVLNLNARVADREKEQNESTVVTFTGNPITELLQNLSGEEGLDWEIGGDLENRMGTNGTLKTRMIYSSSDEQESERVSLVSAVPGNVPDESLVLEDSLSTEAIIRSSYSWPVIAGQNLELGLEGAINTLEKDVQLFEVLPDGSLDPVDLNNANSDVEENRFEFFSTHFWQMRENVALESGLNVEYSKIEQLGVDVENARSFTFVKPRFDLRWDLNDTNQMRGSLERTVSQLDFGDFVASFDDDNDQINAGNPDLVPEQAWEWKFTFERRLNNDNGVLEAQLFFNQIEDHIDKVAATDVISAAGNIGDAENYGVNLKGSWRLAPIGIEGAVIDATYRWQQSETTDPFTGQKRDMRWKPTNRYSVRFRHDITAWRLNYTVDMNWWGPRIQQDITYSDVNKSMVPRITFTAQYQFTDSLILWFDTRFVVDNYQRRVRERFDGNIADDVLLRTEVRQQYMRREFIVGFRGQF